MQVQFEAKGTYPANVRGKELVADYTAWPQASLVRAFEYGIQQLLNDAGSKAGASADYESKEAHAKACYDLALGRLEELVTGKVAERKGRTATPATPEAAIAKIAREKVLVIMGKGKRINTAKLDPAKLDAYVADYLRRNAHILEAARAEYELVNAAEGDDFDMDSLLKASDTDATAE